MTTPLRASLSQSPLTGAFFPPLPSGGTCQNTYAQALSNQGIQHGSTTRSPIQATSPALTTSAQTTTPSSWTKNLRASGIDSLTKFDLSSTRTAADSFDAVLRQLRCLGLLEVATHGVMPGTLPANDPRSVEADQACSEILFEMYKHMPTVSRDLRRIYPQCNSGHTILEYLLETYSEPDIDDARRVAEKKLATFPLNFLLSPKTTPEQIRTSVLDFFELTDVLDSTRRGTNAFWAKELVHLMPAEMSAHKLSLLDLIKLDASQVASPNKFSKILIAEVARFKAISMKKSVPLGGRPGADDREADDDSKNDMQVNALRAAGQKFTSSKPKCSKCAFVDCPLASDPSACCDVHSPLSEARILKMMKDNPKYLGLVMHTRKELTENASTPPPATGTKSVSVLSSKEDCYVARDALREQNMNDVLCRLAAFETQE